MSLTQLELINTALIKLGAYKITALNDGSTESDIAGTLYTPVRDALLSAYPWSFATLQVNLTTPSVTAPVADYTYAFDVPNDLVRVLSVGAGGAGAGVIYRLAAGRLETDESTITLSYVRRPPESTQPPYFDAILIARLAAEMCLPITENTARAEYLARQFEQEWIRARQIDAQQDTPARLRSYNLVDVRG